MVFAARLAELLGRAPEGLVARHVRLLSALGLDGSDLALPTGEEIVAAMGMDKKYREGLRFILLEDVGRPVIVEDVDEATIREALGAVGAAR
jgi:3-dehydroquinate synthase